MILEAPGHVTFATTLRAMCSVTKCSILPLRRRLWFEARPLS
jgi:hypothetical protein